MVTPDPAAEIRVTAEIQVTAQIQQFYAQQMQAIDRGDVDAWLDTFTDDATIANNTRPEPARGRATIATVARRLVADAAGSGVVHRHWTGMAQVARQPDGTVRATSYALVVQTPGPAGSTAPGPAAAPGSVGSAGPGLWRSTVCVEVLVREDGRWRIRQRNVTHDDVR